jgi:hypothetical protein
VLWAYTLMLPSIAKSGWLPAGFIAHGPCSASRCCAAAQLFGLTGLDEITHSLFWSLLANIGAYVGCRCARRPNAREASQALLFVGVFDRPPATGVLARQRRRGRPAAAGRPLPRRRAGADAFCAYAAARR